MKRSPELATTPERQSVNGVVDVFYVTDALAAAGMTEAQEEIIDMYRQTNDVVLFSNATWADAQAVKNLSILQPDVNRAALPQYTHAVKAAHNLIDNAEVYSHRIAEESVARVKELLAKRPGQFAAMDIDDVYTDAELATDADGRRYVIFHFESGFSIAGMHSSLGINTALMSEDERRAVESYVLSAEAGYEL